MADISDFDLYKHAYALANKVYDEVEHYPASEVYVLVPQFKRASLSIVANISEGYRKRGAKEKLHFYNISLCSLEECKTYAQFSGDRGFGSKELRKEFDELGKKIHAYCKAIRNNPQHGEV